MCYNEMTVIKEQLLMKKIFALVTAAALVLGCFCGCGALADPDPTTGGITSGNNNGGTGSSATAEGADFAQTDSDMFTQRDLSGSYDDATAIDLGSGDVTITREGTYILSGKLTDGSVTVDAGDAKVQLVLNGVEITCSDGAPICILDANKVFITLAEGTENTLENGGTLNAAGGYDVDAAVYSRCDLTINGSGSLNVISPAGHGISCKDDLAITGGSITVTCANQAIDANDSIRICGGTLTLDSGKDGIHAENNDDASLGFVYISGGTMSIECEGDGISAGAYLHISSGTFTILAGGGYENGSSSSSDGWGGMGGMGGMHRPGQSGSSSSSSDDSTSMKGLKAGNGILISGGTFTIDTADDAIHSDASVTIDGGTYTIASGDDGIHAEDTLTVTSCTMTISESYEGLEAEKIYFKGGTVWMNCSDDGLNASGGTDGSGEGGRDGMFGGGGGMMGGRNSDATIEVSGGSLTIYARGDGLDSNGDLTISGGFTTVFNPSSGDVSVLDSENQPIITGGTYIGLGITTSMAEVFSTKSTQGFIACTTGNYLSAGTDIVITDADGNEILSVTTEYSTILLILSCPEMVKGEDYTITAGTVTGTLSAS